MNSSPFLLRNVYHSWPSSGVQACNDVSLTLRCGEVQALVGENGAGKTTLGHILAGVQVPERGILTLDGETLNLAGRNSGFIPGIALVRQRNVWPPSLKIWEAAAVGRERLKKRWRSKNWIEKLQETSIRWKINDFDPTRLVSSLDAAARQRAELVAALLFQPRILVLDEPSSAWEEGRANEFFALMDALKAANVAVLLVTHRLNDVFQVANRVTAMRHGSIRGTWKIDQIDSTALTTHIFGDAPRTTAVTGSTQKVHRPEKKQKELRLENVYFIEGGRTRLRNVSFQVKSGEILAIAGLREEGLSILEDIVSGNRKPSQGNVYIGEKLVNGNPPGIRKAGLSYVPSDKTGRGASMSSTLAENMLLLEAASLSRGGWLNPIRVRKWAERRRVHAEISGNPDQKLEQLSGGNIQRVILQRELAGNPQLLTVADPSWGLDERSKQRLYENLRYARSRGAAILLLASDLDEAFALSDRMGIISNGVLSPIRPIETWTRSQATRMISGGSE